MSGFYRDSIFWVEVDKISPNPYQPRKEFDQEEMQSLADSIRQYGVLQALVVTRNELPKEDGGLQVTYELISGERRLRAAKLAEVKQVPVIIRTGEESQEMKLELAIIENLQREDLNVVDRARAFERLAKEFGMSHGQIARKVGKSREYISNNLRVLSLPQEILDNLSAGKLSEGHARPLMRLNDRPEEQLTLQKEVIYKKLNVRETEKIARKIAHEKNRKKSSEEEYDPHLAQFEKQFSQSLGTRVHIEKRAQGGRLSIDFFSEEDLKHLLELVSRDGGQRSPTEMMDRFIQEKQERERQAAMAKGEGYSTAPPAEPPAEPAAAPEERSEPAGSGPTEWTDTAGSGETAPASTPASAPAPAPDSAPETAPETASETSEPYDRNDPRAPITSSGAETPAGAVDHSSVSETGQPLETPVGEAAASTPAADPWSLARSSAAASGTEAETESSAASQDFQTKDDAEEGGGTDSRPPDDHQPAEEPTERSEESAEADDEEDLYSVRNFTI